jgi:hypothetical protein
MAGVVGYSAPLAPVCLYHARTWLALDCVQGVEIFEAAAPHCRAAISGRRPANHKHRIQSGASVLRFMSDGERGQSSASGLAKVAVQCSADTFVVN